MREFGVDGSDRTIQIDGTAGVSKDKGRQAQTSRIQRRVPHAKVIGQTGKKDTAQTAIAQVAGEAGRSGVVILKKCRIGVDLAAEALAEDELGPQRIEIWMELRTSAALQAVIRPEGLRAVGHFDLLKRFPVSVRGRE